MHTVEDNAVPQQRSSSLRLKRSFHLYCDIQLGIRTCTRLSLSAHRSTRHQHTVLQAKSNVPQQRYLRRNGYLGSLIVLRRFAKILPRWCPGYLSRDLTAARSICSNVQVLSNEIWRQHLLCAHNEYAVLCLLCAQHSVRCVVLCLHFENAQAGCYKSARPRNKNAQI